MKKCLVTFDNGIEFDNSLLADSFFSRFKGFMFTFKPKNNQAMIITKCNSIHTMFMFFSIDVLYADKDYNIVKCQTNIKPWRMSNGPKKTYHTIEVKHNTLNGISNIKKVKVSFNE